METRANYALIGVFTLAVLFSAFMFVFWFSQASKEGTREMVDLMPVFRGLICIRSADDSPEDRQRYIDCGAHCSFGAQAFAESRPIRHMCPLFLLSICKSQTYEVLSPTFGLRLKVFTKDTADSR